MVIRVPEVSLVVLVGPSGCGKSTLAAKHFAPTEVLSSDRFRAIVADDEADQRATPAAFELLHHALELRLSMGKLTVIDATNVERRARTPLVRIARESNVQAVAIVLDLDLATCVERDRGRSRSVGEAIIREQRDELARDLADLAREGFRSVTVLRTLEEIERAQIVREPSTGDRPIV
jgi:protein phosphatase